MSDIKNDSYVFVASPSFGFRRSLADTLHGMGNRCLTCRNLRSVLAFESRGIQISHILVDLEAFGGASIIFDELRAIRKSLPGSAFVLISSEFECDEMGNHRAFVTDVSLRAPVSKETLEFSLTQAVINRRLSAGFYDDFPAKYVSQ
ncbi:hypothetical protein C8N36_13517 [Pelagimonas varians]|uniref:Response regulatory domain-containing protein n=1 Tax=Pelagimonas varians TaxID=696760 RepID=A0A238L5P0_9RHOB|nr:hypothetical protein C8N36_13517 [Pelagimonas varians]SMX50405.1 hypothetical protein PEV8663_04632 [Pelagimonas varians]